MNLTIAIYMKSELKIGLLKTMILLTGLATSSNMTFARTAIENLRVEYCKTPIGIDIENPRFSWQMVTDMNVRDQMQTAYQIVVKDPDEGVMWDSKRVKDGTSLGIVYSGAPLKAATRYSWTVIIWDKEDISYTNNSWFETGLMNSDPGLSAWDGAKWIGGSPRDLVFQSNYLSVFKVKYSLKLDRESNSTRAAFILGANDSRLLDKNKNIFNIESKQNGSYIKLELDISSVDGSASGLAKFNVYRVGYHPNDVADKPFFSVSVPQKIISDLNKYEKHSFFLESTFGSVTVIIDAKDNDHKLTPGQGGQSFGGGGLNLNPVGKGGDYIAFPLLSDIGFSVDSGQKASFSNVVVTHYREPSNDLFAEDLLGSGYHGIYEGFIKNMMSGFSVKDGSYNLNGEKGGTFIVADPSRNSMPMLRTEFIASGNAIKDARLYVTARGIYEIFLNGKRVGNDYFNPGLTQYNITHMYQTYDVTDLVIPGYTNAVAAWLGEGWWSGNSTFIGTNWNFFGDRQSLLAKLVITYADGSKKIITTNDQDWKFFNNGPVIYGSFFQGELFDATKESLIKGWDRAGYDDHEWVAASEIKLDGTVYNGSATNFDGSKSNLSFDKMSLIGQIGENAGIVKELNALSVTELRPGVFVYDMGQNMVGIPQIRINEGRPGEKVTLRYAEVKYPDLPESGKNVGMIMIENIRAALAQDIYIMKGGNEIIQPHFTFHGYRYLEISGLSRPLPLESVKGLVISSIHELSSSYETSDKKVNRLWENIVWSSLGNFLSVPTDCPQRNERMGWSGDLSVFSRTATYVSNLDPFLSRHLLAMRNLQLPSGKFTDIAPLGGGFGGLLWGSAGMTLPWELYQQYNDVRLLREHYNAMKAYMDFLQSRINKETGLCSESQLGDWLGPQTKQVSTQLIVTAYHIFDLQIMINVAKALNKVSDAEKYQKMYNERKEFFNRNFVNSEKKAIQGAGGKLSDNQTSYAVGIALGAFSDENLPFMVKNLAETVIRENKDDDGIPRPSMSLMTGFIGTAWISKALSDNGLTGLAYRIIENNKYPSWIYSIDQGATTIWERLNGYTIEKGFGGNNSMNSFNHYSFGAVGQWMMAYSLGIQRDEPGFRKFILKPEPDPSGQMTWVKGYYDSMYGRISSEWKIENNLLIYNAVVPPNTSATLYLPASAVKSVKESGKPLKKSGGITFIKYESGKAVYELKSGSYRFNSRL
jgi:alpha-L-rhamnosidase